MLQISIEKSPQLLATDQCILILATQELKIKSIFFIQIRTDDINKNIIRN
jgi:hypothetical protein